MYESQKSTDLIKLFNECFRESENTILVGNADEPVYLPASNGESFDRVIFTKDYFSSALHEIAHWCVAGKQRRRLVDYGYWYLPDGRDAEQQKRFEQVEVTPQAIECAFSKASAIKFRVSIDNLSGEQNCSKAFETAVSNRLNELIITGFNARTQRFLAALHTFYKTPPFTMLEHK
ncbi:elongation factor P hydroxylase [Glaciecola sp. MH2013]|nr:elongation factor P hydroxylase [Glaciecola sp. MH2013]